MSERNQQIRASIIYRATNIEQGSAADFGSFYFFRDGNRLGAAISTGDRLINIHNVHPGQSYLLEGVCTLPLVQGNFLTLTVDVNETDLRDRIRVEDFADRVLAFVDEDIRDELVADPWLWAEKIIAMTGNSTTTLRPYPYIAEVYLLNSLRAAGLLVNTETEYRGPAAGTHDFELRTFSMECKSHLHGDPLNGELVISSEHQLARTGDKPLYVVYFPMEDTGTLSLEQVVADYGMPRQDILSKLAKSGFVEGDFAWQRPYHFLGDPLVYEINDNFPRITPQQFPDGHFPGGITKLVYHVSLRNLPSCPLNRFIDSVKNGITPEFSA